MPFKAIRRSASRAVKKQENTSPVVKLKKERKFKAEIVAVAPKMSRSKLLSIGKGFIAVKLEDPAFEPNKAIAYRDFANRYLKQCRIFIGDGIHRLILQLRDGLTEMEAREKSIRIGKEYLEKNYHLFGKEHPCDFQIRFGSEVRKTAQYRRLYNLLMMLHTKDREFSSCVRRCAIEFLARQDVVDNTIQVPGAPQSALTLCRQYFIEELATFGTLVKEGWPVVACPGSLPILKEIAEKKHPGIPESLQKLISISLRVKRQGSATKWIARVWPKKA